MPINPGLDASGNGNNWTPINIEWIVSGANYDIMVDTPTSYGTDTGVGGEVRGNYCTWNPLYGSTPTLANGNLDATTNNTTAYGSISFTSGKWYWEITVGNANYIGVMDSTYIKTDNNWGSQAIAYVSNGNKYNGTGSAYGASYTTNDVIGVAIDMDAGTIAFYKNGVSQGTAFSSGLAGREFRPLVYSPTSGTQTANFGQRAFAYTAPSGFKALCTQNLPTPTIGATSTTQANDYFNVLAYSGTGSNQTLTVGFQPDFAWFKKRSAAESHILQNSIAGNTKFLISNSTAAEDTSSALIQSFNSDGVTIGTSSTINGTSTTYAGWFWNAGGSTVTNTSGTISAQVRANTTSGFSIVTYTGTGANATVGHGLGVTPGMIIIKSRSSGVFNWAVWHTSLGGGDNALQLNNTGATYTAFDYWNGNPTSTVFTLGTDSGSNQSSGTYVAYVFAPVAGYSAFGSYTGNGSTDGPFVYLGFRPEFVMIKNITTAGTSWEMFDNARETSNLMDLELLANSSAAEGTYTYGDFVSNGFKLRSTNNGVNQSTATLVYMAFAENPFKYALAR